MGGRHSQGHGVGLGLSPLGLRWEWTGVAGSGRFRPPGLAPGRRGESGGRTDGGGRTGRTTVRDGRGDPRTAVPTTATASLPPAVRQSDLHGEPRGGPTSLLPPGRGLGPTVPEVSLLRSLRDGLSSGWLNPGKRTIKGREIARPSARPHTSHTSLSVAPEGRALPCYELTRSTQLLV